MAGYFDNCANVESEDLNAEAETAVVPEIDLGDLGVRLDYVK
jgi:hypothetical protein